MNPTPENGVERLPTRGDIALAASLLGVAVLSGLSIDVNRPNTIEPSSWWHWLLIVIPSLLVAVRRLNPVVTTVLATLAQAIIWTSDLPEVLLPIIVILYTASSDAGEFGRRVAIGCSVALTIVTGVGVVIADDVRAYQLPLIALTCGTAVALGANAARQRQVAETLAGDVVETRLTSEHDQARAIADERSHIARELHDIIGHTLSVIAVRAEAADRVGDRNPAAATDAVAAIATVSREALAETRRVLAGLRDSSVVELAPPPDLAATERLVTDLAAAGVNASVLTSGCDDRVPPAVVAGGAHRIVQESLTNAIKHGGPKVSIKVELGCGPDVLDICVTNSVSVGPNVGRTERPGIGLAGMAERVEVLGGTLETGRSGDQFVVRATLPTGMPNREVTS